MTRSSSAVVASVALLAALASAPATARADDKQACVDASDQAQKLRDEKKLTKSREQLLACARDTCPAVVRKDCSQWLSEVEASMPTVVLSARSGNGQDLTTGKVYLDGQLVNDKLDGKAVLVDPGPHTFRIEVDGEQPWEQQVVVREGEKNRGVTATFGQPGAAGGGAGGAATSGGGGASVGGEESKGPPVAALVIGGVGLVALGSFAYFGLTGKKDVSDLRDTCGQTHSCEQSKVDSAKTKLIVADISLGVGVVALGVATYLFITHNSGGSAKANVGRAPRLDVSPLPGGGGYASVGTRF